MRISIHTVAAFISMVACSLLTPTAIADEQSDRASLVGYWVQTGGPGVWIIKAVTGGLHVSEIEGGGTVAYFQCTTDGQNCEVKISGRKASVSMYYNGGMLVQLETKGDKVVKRRFSIMPSGSSLKVEVTAMTGKSETETLQFERGQPADRK